ncbi:MAG: dynamin family protein, partial [Syntrophomonadaceae bacterium]|nr:dynamin family protein [Syntrophomonadaceae bacterium]
MRPDANAANLHALLLDRITETCREFGLESLTTTVRSVSNFAAQNRYLDVAVLGQFKAGKSSFINSLIGQPVLPVGSIPVTSVITRVTYGPAEKATVVFNDDSRRAITLAELGDYVSEAGNPENQKDVFLVDVEVPSLADIKDLRLVDTPGIGSVWAHNTETTTSWFPETGGAILLISAERPISEGELSLLQEVHRFTPELCIVISKVDLFTEAQVSQIESFTRTVVERTLGRAFPVVRFSAFADSTGYARQVREQVLRPLAAHRQEIFSRVLDRKVATLAESCLAYLDIAYQASSRAESEREKLKQAILDEHLNSGFIRRDLQLITASYKEKTREAVRSYLEQFRQGIEERVMQDFARCVPTWRGNLYRLTRQYERWLREVLTAELQEILLEEDKSFDLLNAVRKHLTFYLRSFRERLGHNLLQVLGVQMKGEEWDISLRELRKPDISISRSFESHLDMLWFLFPMFIFRPLFERHFARQVPYEVEKNLHRLTSGLTERINKEMDALMEQAL